MRLKLIDLLGASNISNWDRFVNESQYWPSSLIQDYQNNNLQKLIDHAFNSVPYYKKIFNKLGNTSNDFHSVNDLRKLPILKREDLIGNYEVLKSNHHKDLKPQYRSTGGTTGAPANYLSDINSWSLHWALKKRAWQWGGHKLGAPIGLLGGASIIPDRKPGVKRKVWNMLNGFYSMPSSQLNNEKMSDFVEIIQKNKIRFLRGYPSSIATLADFCLENKYKLDIKSVFTTAEVLQPVYKEKIKQAFGCTIIDTYGCADGGGNANTCEYDNGFHISWEASIWEVCDENGNSVPEGEIGELTLTSLTNLAMPLIRYQPGDLIENRFIYDTCKCGRTMPRIKKIIGRTTDILKFSNGNSLGGPALTLLFREFPIINYQLVQNTLTSLDVNIIPSDEFNTEHRKKIERILKHHCGEDIMINIDHIKQIAQPVSGKHRFIINNTLQ